MFTDLRSSATSRNSWLASATRPRVVHHSDLRDTRRLTDRRGYDDDRSSGWSFDLFGGDR